ncbi:MAG TPA: GerMN domain-containing protein [Candidatus Dormibacteraeota bacterium]|nr:GerMN domain-containing protein [Candidatus Dormibacteraeota bacterium]
MSKRARIAVIVLAALVAAGIVDLPRLYRQVVGLRRIPVSEEAEQHAVLQPPVPATSAATEPVPMYWASASAPGTLKATDVEMKLSADPVERGKQLLAALIAGPTDPNERTLPPAASLLEFYLLPEGVAVADFSSELATELPSGIQSEQLAVESIADTLAANIPDLRRLKILIDGQEVQTLAGHIDLTGYFILQPPSADATPPAPIHPPVPALTGPGSNGKLIR